MDLEKLASQWVDRCEFAHPDPKVHPQYSGSGQNLAVTGGSPRNVTQMAVMWYNEVAHYHYDTHTCDPGKVCGHYTQVSKQAQR